MSRAVILWFCTAFLAAAILVTEPASGDSWDLSKPQTISWSSVVTDPSSLRVELTNRQISPPVVQVLGTAQTVDGKLVVSGVTAPAVAGYRIDIVDLNDDGILAESGVFTVSNGQGSSSSSGSSSSTSTTTGSVSSSSTAAPSGKSSGGSSSKKLALGLGIGLSLGLVALLLALCFFIRRSLKRRTQSEKQQGPESGGWHTPPATHPRLGDHRNLLFPDPDDLPPTPPAHLIRRRPVAGSEPVEDRSVSSAEEDVAEPAMREGPARRVSIAQSPALEAAEGVNHEH